MAGLNNDQNPILSQVRLGPQNIQLVPGPPGPPGTGALTIQSNDGVIVQRGTLDLVGLAYTDTGSAMRFAAGVPAPNATVSAAYIVGASETWVLFTGGNYAISLQNAVGGQLMRLTHVGPTRLDPPSAVTVSRGTATFVIENPQDRSQATANSQALSTSFVTYNFLLDSTNNILRCVGIG